MTKTKAQRAPTPAPAPIRIAPASVGFPSTYKKPLKQIGSVPVPVELVGPRSYACRARGACMEPELHDGDIVVMDPDAEPTRGATVALFVEGIPNILIKVLDDDLFCWPAAPGSNVAQMIRVRMLNPARVLHFDGQKVKAIHPVVYAVKGQ